MTREEMERNIREAAEILCGTVETRKLPKQHDPKKCASCGAPIFWARDESGKPRPIDAAPSADGTVRLFDRKGTIIWADTLTTERARYAGKLRTPHSKTCSKRDEWGQNGREGGHSAGLPQGDGAGGPVASAVGGGDRTDSGWVDMQRSGLHAPMVPGADSQKGA